VSRAGQDTLFSWSVQGERTVPSDVEEEGGSGLLRVGIFSSFYPEIHGGAETSLAVLLDGLQRMGLDQVLVTLSNAQQDTPIRVIRVGRFGRVPKRMKLFGLPGLNSILANRLSKLLRENQIGLLHVNDTYSLRAAGKAAEAVGIPLVLSYHNNLNIPYSSYGIPFPFSSWLDYREKGILKAARKCSVVIADSNYIANRLVEAGLSPACVKRIYIGGSMSEWGSPPTSHDHSHIRVLSVGVMQYHKGFQDLILAIKKLSTDGVPLDVTIVGDGPYRGKLLRLAEQSYLMDRIKFVGRVAPQELTRLYDWSDAVVVPTITPEPFGRVAVEAMSRGRPVIGTAIGGLTEIIDEGRTGYHVPPATPSAIAEKLLIFQNHRELVEEMGARGLERCKMLFDQSLITSQVFDIYRSLVPA
jgi:glycosyltransferase involved in cell wall biosynthesis